MKNEETDQTLVTITTVDKQFTAYMIKDILEDAGIKVFLQNEITAQLYASAAGGIAVQVSDTEAEKARRLLNEIGNL
jgi:hypothetical protein